MGQDLFILVLSFRSVDPGTPFPQCIKHANACPPLSAAYALNSLDWFSNLWCSIGQLLQDASRGNPQTTLVDVQLSRDFEVASQTILPLFSYPPWIWPMGAGFKNTNNIFGFVWNSQNSGRVIRLRKLLIPGPRNLNRSSSCCRASDVDHQWGSADNCVPTSRVARQWKTTAKCNHMLTWIMTRKLNQTRFSSLSVNYKRECRSKE